MIKYRLDGMRHRVQICVSVYLQNCQWWEACADRNMLRKFEELSNGFISKFKLTSQQHGINIGKKKDIESEDIPKMSSSPNENVARKPNSYCATNFAGGQISIPITRKDHYAILDFSHNKKHKYWKKKNLKIKSWINNFYFLIAVNYKYYIIK